MNQYRCETCKHRIIALKYVTEMNGSNWQCKIGNDKRDLTPERQVIISERGCASHSDFQSEREKVLDILDKRCKICAKEHCTDEKRGVFAIDLHRDPFNEVRVWIKALRQEGKP